MAGQGYTVFTEHRHGGFDEFDLAGRKHSFSFGAEGGTVEGLQEALGDDGFLPSRTISNSYRYYSCQAIFPRS
jgi:hypothetical protein